LVSIPQNLGSPLVGSSPARVPSSSRPDPPPRAGDERLGVSILPPEMKQVTVLFCDIVNSTPLTERLGPEGMSDVVRAFLDASLAEIRRFGGHRLLAECLAQESPAVAAEHVDAAQ
jgi:class 3 adenylate cyclase